jgi:hypothetical protein
MAGYRRRPVEVTSDRLGDHYERLYDRFYGEEREAISIVRMALERIAEEDEAATLAAREGENRG